MSNQQSNPKNKICMLIFSLLLSLIYYSTKNNSKDFRMKLINSITQSYQPYYNQSQQQKNLFNITTIPNNYKYFQLIQMTPLKSSVQIQRCGPIKKQNSFLLINSNTKLIGLKFVNLIKTFAINQQNQQNLSSSNNCLNFRIFVLKQKKILSFQQNYLLLEYQNEISQTIQIIQKSTQNKIDILASEQGSALVLESLLKLIQENNFSLQMSKKLNKVILINLYNRVTSINNEPSGIYLQKVKQRIISNKIILKTFNQLNFIMLNTLKQQYQLLNKLIPLNSDLIKNSQSKSSIQSQQTLKEEQKITNNYFVFKKQKHYSLSDESLMNQLQRNSSQSFDSVQFKQIFDISQQKYLILENSHILHTRQMSNLHVQLAKGQYFTYQPFLQILSKLIKENNNHEMTHQKVEYYFKYGQGSIKFPFQFLSKISQKQCVVYRVHFEQPSLWNTNKNCFRLTVNATFSNMINLIYSDEGKFDIYSQSLVKLQEHDKNLKKSVYLFEKIQHQFLIYNPKGLKIIIVVGISFSPANPLTQIFSEFQILYMDQVDQKTLYDDQITRKFVVKTCTNNLLIFPDNFLVGKYHRQFLLQNSNSSCYKEISTYWNFMENFFNNQILLKNFIIFLLLIGFVKKKTVGQCGKVTFIGTWALLCYTQLRAYHIVVIIIGTYWAQKILHSLCYLNECIHIDRNKVFICMILMFFVSWVCQGFIFQQYHYWKMLLIFLIFFVNEDNAIIIGIKLYYLQDSIRYGVYDWFQIIQLVLYINATQQSFSNKYKKLQFLDFMCKILLIFGCTINLIFYPNSASFHNFVTYYMKAKVLCSSLEKLG